MSTLDDQTKEVVGDADVEDTENSQDKNPSGFMILFFILGFIASLLVGWIVFPMALYSKQEQPVAFNHALHMDEVDDGCESCHFFRDDGSYSGVPKLEQCIDCHSEVEGESASDHFVSEYVLKEREVPWLIYSKQPDCVFFSHAAHVKKAKMECVTCHGPFGEMESLPIYEENRITGYSRAIWGNNIAGFKKHSYDRMKMDDCADCHKEANNKITSVQTGRDACFVCHK